MATEMQIVNVAMEATCFAFSAALLVSMLITRAYKTKLTRIFLWMVAANCAALLCDAMAWGFAGWPKPGVWPFLMAANFLMYFMSYTQFALTAYYVKIYLSMRKANVHKGILVLFMAILAGAIGLITATQFNGSVYFIDESNLFRAGPLYGVLHFFTFALALLFSVLILAYRKSFGNKELGAILFFLLSLLSALVAETFLPEIMFINAMTSISLVVLFVLIHFQREVEYAEMESSYKTSIMLSQIQPHFLYNTLSAISYLCERDGAEQADKAVHQFSDYLRGNMDSLSFKRPIPFAKELEHTRLYLSLEQQQYEDRLQVELDIQATDFALPAISLQPLVENAVKHGTGKRDEGGKITVRTTEEETHWRITVIDNGVGFDPLEERQDGNSHIGIENVRHRLESMCGGALTVSSRPGIGTQAVITIPKEGAQ